MGAEQRRKHGIGYDRATVRGRTPRATFPIKLCGVTLSIPALLVAVAWAFLMAAAWGWIESRALRAYHRQLQEVTRDDLKTRRDPREGP